MTEKKETKETYVEVFHFNTVTPNKKEAGNVIVSAGEWLKAVVNKRMSIEFKISIVKDEKGNTV